MAIAKSACIHPTAVLDPEAEIAAGVQVGPFVVIEGAVRLGEGCVVRPGVHLFGPMTVGENNVFHSHAIIGDLPQHLKYVPNPSSVVIGDNNTFREHVTVHRPVVVGGVTRIGNNNFLMASAHIAHDCVVGNNCIFANSALVAGHCTVEDGVTMSGNSAVHQHCRVGRLSLISGVSASSMDVVPFMIYQRINVVCGVNIIGMRRAGIPAASIEAVRKAYHILYLGKNIVSHSLLRLEAEMGHIPEVMQVVSFIRGSKRGVSLDIERQAA
jgi:UDP-N-acetylglucosamine acyltransferase